MIEKRRTPGFLSHCALVSPVTEHTPFLMPFCESFDQRSPHRLVVAFALSITLNISTSSSTRFVTVPCTSPMRKTVCLSPPFAAVRRMRATSYMSTEMTEATMPMLLPQPTMPAIFSSLKQFCSDTK